MERRLREELKLEKERKTKVQSRNTGITLIALIITIIVLLILAGVTINLTLGENGIFRTAEMAGKNYMDAQDRELAGLADFENMINNIVGGIENATVGEEKQQLVTKITLNKSEIALEVNKTETLIATVEPSNAYNKNLKWSTTNENIVIVNNGELTAVNPGTVNITAEAQDGSGVKATCTITVEGQLKNLAQPGTYVKYDTGIDTVGDNGIVTFRVLYNNDTYGLQIISDKKIEDVTLGTFPDGYNDLVAWQASMNDYNNAIDILNEKAEYYAQSSPYALDGRCVGSVPTIGEDGKFNAKDTEVEGTYIIPDEWTLLLTSRDTGCQKWTDTNYITDRTAMLTANIMTTGEAYWLASRYVYLDANNLCDFYVRSAGNGGMDSYNLCALRSFGDFGTTENTIGLRPCISLKSDVKVLGGDGETEETAYELGI